MRAPRRALAPAGVMSGAGVLPGVGDIQHAATRWGAEGQIGEIHSTQALHAATYGECCGVVSREQTGRQRRPLENSEFSAALFLKSGLR